MRRGRKIGAAAGAGIVLCAALAALAAQTLYVQVAETRLRAAAGFLSPSVGVLSYGDSVEKLAENQGGAWLKVRNQKTGEGWLHGSALTQTALVLKAGEQSAAPRAQRAEPTLGGKGFDAETEGGYQARNPKLLFPELDRIEAAKPADEDVLAFAREGGLRP